MADIDKIAEELLGTCKELDEVLGYHALDIDTISQEQLEELDSKVLLCDSCGWWDEADLCQDHEGILYCNECYQIQIEGKPGEGLEDE